MLGAVRAGPATHDARRSPLTRDQDVSAGARRLDRNGALSAANRRRIEPAPVPLWASTWYRPDGTITCTPPVRECTSTITSQASEPTREPRTEVRLGARAHTTRTTNHPRAAPPT